MNKIVEIDGISYEVNLDKAKELGLVKKSRESIKKITSGDVFFDPDGLIANIIVVKRYDESWSFHGFGGGLFPYSDYRTGVSEADILQYLNQVKMVFIGSLNGFIEGQIRYMIETYKNQNK